MRTLSSAQGSAVGNASTQPAWLISIDWGDVVTRMCSFGPTTWAGEAWVGYGISVGEFDDQNIPGRLVIFDPVATFRTLFLANGIRDRAVQVWAANMDALADDDPTLLFDGVASQGSMANGKLTVSLDRSSSGFTLTPRERIGQRVGANFTATPGEVLLWNSQRITIGV